MLNIKKLCTGAIFFASLNLSVYSQECHMDSNPSQEISNGEFVCWHSGNSNSLFDQYYVPNENTQIKTINIKLHVMQKSDG